MAGYQMNNFFGASPLTIDTHNHKYFEDDESEVLDENILDSALEMSPPMNGSRRDSYAISTTIFSPKNEDWQHAVEMQRSTSNHLFGEQSNNGFMPPVHAQSFTHQPHGWMSNGSGNATPMQPYDGIPATVEFDNAPLAYRPAHGQTPFTNPQNQVSLFTPSNTSPESLPTSPQKQWNEATMEFRGMPKRMRDSSPGLRSHSPFLRRDGIRKKNARFEIPQDRNLGNIDELIADCDNEPEMKELKQQKRLLRNRQAALDSRQRKKIHTERLEDEKKHFSQFLGELEQQLDAAKEQLALQSQQYDQYVNSIQQAFLMEKEEMIRAHTLETGDLRKKVNVLTETVHKLENSAASALPSATSFAAEFSEVDSLAMDGAWDSISFLHDFPGEDVKPDLSALTTKTNIVPTVSEEKPGAQGLLCMLLILGTYIAATGTSARIPLSDDVRAASTTLLQDMYKDAGVPQSASGIAGAVAPLPSGASWDTSGPAHVNPNDISSFGSSSLGDFANSLTQSTEQQENEQLFGLSVSQYHGVSSPDFSRNDADPITVPSRRNLAETLAAMRGDGKESAAEVYTRSLLWDQVPRDVVRNFAKLVADHSRTDQNGGDFDH